MNRQTNIRD